MLETINDLVLSLNAGEHTDLILLDFSKALDKVSHNCLLHKLTYYGINGELCSWITTVFTKCLLLNTYLGVIIDHLSWSDHIGAVTRKANGVYAFLQRNAQHQLRPWLTLHM